MLRTLRSSAALLAMLAIVACAPPRPPEEERRPAPQAQAHATSSSPSAIVEQANAYKDRAQDAQANATDRRREAIDAATR